MRDVFHTLLATAAFKEAWVEEVWDESFKEGCSTPRFVTSFND